jgi:hypothetical protein
MKFFTEEERVIARKETMAKAHKKYAQANKDKINAYQNQRNAKIREAKKMQPKEDEEKQETETSTCVCSTCGHVHIHFK